MDIIIGEEGLEPSNSNPDAATLATLRCAATSNSAVEKAIIGEALDLLDFSDYENEIAPILYHMRPMRTVHADRKKKKPCGAHEYTHSANRQVCASIYKAVWTCRHCGRELE